MFIESHRQRVERVIATFEGNRTLANELATWQAMCEYHDVWHGLLLGFLDECRRKHPEVLELFFDFLRKKERVEDLLDELGFKSE